MKHQELVDRKSALKANLLKQYNETLFNLQRLEGAIAVLNQLGEEEENTSETTSEANSEANTEANSEDSE